MCDVQEPETSGGLCTEQLARIQANREIALKRRAGLKQEREASEYVGCEVQFVNVQVQQC